MGQTVRLELTSKYLTTPQHEQNVSIGQFFKVEWIRFEFFWSVATPKLQSTVYPTILPKAGRRIVEIIPFLKVLAPCEMQTASSRIWTRVTVSISYELTCNGLLDTTSGALILYIDEKIQRNIERGQSNHRPGSSKVTWLTTSWRKNEKRKTMTDIIKKKSQHFVQTTAQLQHRSSSAIPYRRDHISIWSLTYQ